MKELKDGIRSLVRIDFHGNVHKKFRGTDADKRFTNEVTVLKELEARGCPNVPRLLDSKEETLTIITTNCGTPVEILSDSKAKALFHELEEIYGIRHDDPEARNVTYSANLGRFCLIDFELSEILPLPKERSTQGHHLRTHWAAMSEQGAKHLANDDSFFILSVDQKGAKRLGKVGEALLDPEHIIYAVSDGMGGKKAGDFASKLILRFIEKEAAQLYEVISKGEHCTQALENLVKSIHQGVISLSSKDPALEGCGATLTLAWLTPERLYWVHIGDSRLYLRGSDGTEQITQDDCVLWHRMKKGEISEYGYRSDPRRARLNDALGGGHSQVYPQSGDIQLKPGARIFLCTDGIMDGLWDKQIVERIESKGSLEEITGQIVEKSNENDPNDDTTVILADFEIV